MKLHEFTDRLYAMGGIEQEEKRSRRLNESLNEMVQREDMREFMDDFIASMNTLNDKWNPGTWQLENAFEWYIDRCGDTEEDEEWLRSQEDFEESLTEARNPENDEVNAIIRKWANSSRNRLSKRDQKILADNGISLEDMVGEYQKKELSGPGRSTGVSGSYPQVLSKKEVKGYHPDADLLGVLSKDIDREEVEYDYPDYKHGDHRMTSSDKSHQLTSGKTKKGAKVKMPTKSQMDALQPYRKEKDDLKRAKKEYEEQRGRIKDRAEWKRWERKNV